jgi:predicted Zn-dependent protease with MMP-like domain
MEREAFEALVERALLRLPKRFKNKMRNITVEVEDAPSRELLAELGIRHGTLLGLYRGVPLTERGWNYGNMLPDRITIFQQPIEETATSSEEIEDVVIDTVIHEVGHYFGFSDAELGEFEKSKRRKK